MNEELKKIGERVELVRSSLHMSREKFGQAIGLSGSEINNIERAKIKNVPLRKLKFICSTYNIDYNWLMTGEGEMMHVSPDALADRINDLLEGENETAKALFRAFAAFGESDWETVRKFIDALQEDGAE